MAKLAIENTVDEALMRDAEGNGEPVVVDELPLDYVQSFAGVGREDLFEFEVLAESEEFNFLVLAYFGIPLPSSLHPLLGTNTLSKH